MKRVISIHLDDDDQIECRHALSDSRPEGYPVLTIGARCELVDRVDLFPGRDRLERLYSVIGAYLAAHPIEPDGSADRIDVVPAEAVVGWDDEPTEAELATARRNCPREGF